MNLTDFIDPSKDKAILDTICFPYEDGRLDQIYADIQLAVDIQVASLVIVDYKEVVKTLPQEELLNIAKKLDEYFPEVSVAARAAAWALICADLAIYAEKQLQRKMTEQYLKDSKLEDLLTLVRGSEKQDNPELN